MERNPIQQEVQSFAKEAINDNLEREQEQELALVDTVNDLASLKELLKQKIRSKNQALRNINEVNKSRRELQDKLEQLNLLPPVREIEEITDISEVRKIVVEYIQFAETEVSNFEERIQNSTKTSDRIERRRKKAE
jgi:hypothetical protein